MTDADARPASGVETHRLHPLTVLLEVGQVAGQLLWFAVIVLVVGSLGGRQAEPGTWLFFLAGSGILVALIRYLSLRYWVDAGRLVIRSGIVAQQVRTIPLDRIQNVELRQNAIQQLAGVVDFRIETAAGPEAEAHLAVLSMEAARRLKARLLADRLHAGGETGTPDRVLVWRAGLGDLLLLGATSNRAGAILGAVVGLMYFLGRELPQYFAAVQDGVVGVVGRVSPVVLAAALLGTMLLLGWLLSIVLTVFGYYGFRLNREPDGRLRRRYGLLSRYETVIQPARIQLLRLSASWLRRRLGYWEIAAHTAGSAFDGHAAGAAMLCPLLRAGQLASFSEALLPGLDMGSVEWRAVSRATIRRGLIRYLVALLATVLAASGPLGPWAFAALAPGIPAAWLLALRRYRVLAWARHAGHVFARAGVVHRHITVVPESKVQWVGLTQSPFQRRLGLATVTVATAAGAARIVDLEESDAAALEERLSGAASAAGAWLPDAV